MFLIDRLHIGESHRTAEGYYAVRCKAARAGIYDYLGREIDPKGEHFQADQVVRVYRPAEEVFNRDSVQSFMLKPITDDHPAKPVTASNWRDYAKGVNAGALRDGEYLAFDLVLMDKALIDAVFPSDGKPAKRELSNGYSSEITIGPGTTDDGHPYDAIQRQIRGNHIAVVDKGRAGSECRITDVAACDSIQVDWLERLVRDERTYTDQPGGDKNSHQRREAVDNGVSQMATKTINFDGMPIESTDAAEAAIRKLEGQLADSNKAVASAQQALKDEQAKVVERDATITAKDATIGELETKLADAAITPAKLQDAAKEYADVCGKAKALGVTFADDADIDAVRKAVVDAKMGDTAKDYDGAHIAIAFDALTRDAKVDPLRQAITHMPTINDNADKVVQDARAAMLADLRGEKQTA